MSSVEALREFCQENGVDDEAREKIEASEPWEIDAILAQGCLTGARNPSAAMISRLKSVQKGTKKGRGKGGHGYDNWTDKTKEAVDNFIYEKELDERAADAIKDSNEWVVEELLQRPMDDARNPSAVCLSLLKRIEQDNYSGRRKGKGRRDGNDWGKGGGNDWGKGGGNDWGRGGNDRGKDSGKGYGKKGGKNKSGYGDRGYAPY